MECTACLTDKIHPRSLTLLIVFLTGSIKPSRIVYLTASQLSIHAYAIASYIQSTGGYVQRDG